MPRTLLTLLAIALLAATATAQPVTVLLSARADGRLENCRCPKDPNGAVEKRLPEIERLRDLGPVLLLDAGNFVPAVNDPLGAEAMINAYELHQYDALTVGHQELHFGPELLREIDSRLPVVSANLHYQDGDRVGEQVKVIERGGETFAVTGIVHPSAVKRLGPVFYDHFSLEDPADALQQAFAKVPDGARRIVLAQMPIEQIRAHPDLFSEADLVLGGHNSDAIDGVEELGDAVLAHVGSNSRSLGMVQFRGSRVKAQLQSISPHLPDDPRVVELVMDLKRERRKHRPEE